MNITHRTLWFEKIRSFDGAWHCQYEDRCRVESERPNASKNNTGLRQEHSCFQIDLGLDSLCFDLGLATYRASVSSRSCFDRFPFHESRVIS